MADYSHKLDFGTGAPHFPDRPRKASFYFNAENPDEADTIAKNFLSSLKNLGVIKTDPVQELSQPEIDQLKIDLGLNIEDQPDTENKGEK